MTSDNQTGKRSLGRRFLWVIWKIIASLLLIFVLAFAVFAIRAEISRSLGSITARIEANKQRVALLNDEVAGLKEADPTGKVDAVQGELDTLASDFTSMQEQMTADLAHQSEMLTALQDEVTTVSSSSATAVSDTAALGDALVALQNDINESNTRIDSLGGEIDGIRAETETVSATVGELGQTAGTAVTTSELDTLQQTLSLFQVWEQIARARLHLSENNVGLAVNDVENGLRLMDLLVAVSAEEDEDTEALELVQTRLALAFNNLPDDPETAVRDLENAWSQLDIILTTRLLPEAVPFLNTTEEITTADEETTTTDTPDESATPEPSPTPEATATPSS